MSRIIRTVSLTKKTDDLASQKGNFSAWVRNQLIQDAHEVTHTHTNITAFEENGVCSPSMTPRCGLCFPYGKPSKDLIKKYNSEKFDATYFVRPNNQGTGKREDHERRARMKKVVENLKEDTKNLYGGLIQDPTPKNQEKEPLTPPMRERKYIRRLVKWLIEWI